MFFNPIYRKLCSDENLNRAWRAVRRQGDSAGLDGMTASHFDARAFLLLKQLQEELRQQRYKPGPVKRIYIKKDIGPPRPLGISTIRDRIVHRALTQILVPIFEPTFDDYSHAYRTGRSPRTALAQARDHAIGGRPWLVKLDVHDCFGTIPLKPLLRQTYRQINDFAVRRLLRRLLDVDLVVQSNSGLRQVLRPEGLLQGSPLSPLLANVYLDTFDRQARQRQLRFVRYGDDIGIFAASRREADLALDLAIQILHRLHLAINKDKTRLYHLEKGCQYLGEWLQVQKMPDGRWRIPVNKSKTA